MVNQDILEGLKHAVARGEPLQKAMMTFFNAGYKKEEIEEAAHIIHMENLKRDFISREPRTIKETKKPLTSEQIQEENIIKEEEKQKAIKEEQVHQVKQSHLPAQQKIEAKPVQVQEQPKNVSNYQDRQEKSKKRMSKGIKITLIVLVILTILVGVFYLLSGVLELF